MLGCQRSRLVSHEGARSLARNVLIWLDLDEPGLEFGNSVVL
jgi:hypothetical protein